MKKLLLLISALFFYSEQSFAQKTKPNTTQSKKYIDGFWYHKDSKGRWEIDTKDKNGKAYKELKFGGFWYKKDKKGIWQIDTSKGKSSKFNCLVLLPDSTFSPSGCYNRYKRNKIGLWELYSTGGRPWKNSQADTIRGQ